MGGFWSDSVPEETLTRDEAGKVLRRLFRMVRPQKWLIAASVLVLMAQAAALLAGPALVAYGIDHGIRAHDGLLESSPEYREVLARAAVEDEQRAREGAGVESEVVP